MALSALYDANVLYPNVLRDALIRVGVEGLVRAHWTETILDETFRSLANNRPDIPAARLLQLRDRMCRAAGRDGPRPSWGDRRQATGDRRHRRIKRSQGLLDAVPAGPAQLQQPKPNPREDQKRPT